MGRGGRKREDRVEGRESEAVKKGARGRGGMKRERRREESVDVESDKLW